MIKTEKDLLVLDGEMNRCFVTFEKLKTKVKPASRRLKNVMLSKRERSRRLNIWREYFNGIQKADDRIVEILGEINAYYESFESVEEMEGDV